MPPLGVAAAAQFIDDIGHGNAVEILALDLPAPVANIDPTGALDPLAEATCGGIDKPDAEEQNAIRFLDHLLDSWLGISPGIEAEIVRVCFVDDALRRAHRRHGS